MLLTSEEAKKNFDILNIYMHSGIKEYWIVDPRNDNTKIYQFKGYEVVTIGNLAKVIL